MVLSQCVDDEMMLQTLKEKKMEAIFAEVAVAYRALL